MKRNKLYSILLAAGSLSLLGGGMVSCDDFLTVLPTDQITEEDFWQEKGDLDNVRAAAYKQMLNCTGKILIWGELRSDNLVLNEMDDASLKNLQQAVLQPTDENFDWAPLYTGINYCNLVLEKGEAMTVPGEEVDPSFRRSDWLPIKAEMYALRALYYFYLVRAYRNVPYVTVSIRTDAEAMRSKTPAVNGILILTNLIAQLEEAKEYAAENYGNSQDNKGRFTKRGVRALLSDIYLWRAAMLEKHADKDNDQNLVMPDGEELTDELVTLLKKESYEKSLENCNWILDDYQAKYDKDLLDNPSSGNTADKDLLYPYLLRIMGNSGSMSKTNVYDNVYYSLWGSKNSSESIFELQFDGSENVNNTINTYLSLSEGTSELSPKKMIGNPALVVTAVNSQSPSPSRGFGIGDFRLCETYSIVPNSSTYPIHKNITTSVTVYNSENVTDLSVNFSGSYRLKNSQNANWPVYRLSDVMLIKAEAIARLADPQAEATAEDGVNGLNEGFKLTNAIFQRYNPGMQATGTAGATLMSDRFKPDYATASPAKNAADLLKLVYNERQREYIAEGKRWFDIVRQAEASNDFADLFTTYIDLATNVKNRLRKIDAFYNPLYVEELKVNDNLKQNPVWDRYSK